MAGDGELNRIIKDLQKTVAELNHSYREQNLPVTDGSRELHSLCAQLEFLLQFDLKEKRTFFGQRKDYWDFLCQGLAQRRQEHEGVRFVTSLDKLKTPVGRGRAFLRYCLVHRQLAESLQLCLLDPESLREWYYARSPFLSPQRRAEILGSLYELDGVTFHLALRRADLDIAWPMFSETLAGGVKVEEENVEVKKAVEEDEEEMEEDEDEEEDKDVEVDVEEDVELEKDMEEADEEELEEDEKELEDSGRTEVSLRALVSRLQAELGQQEAVSRALASRLAREQRRHRRREEASARRAQLRAQEAEALRETNTFLGQALAAAVAAGGLGALAQAQEEAQRWREAAEEQGARLAGALAEVAALASRLQDCQTALAAAAGQTDTVEDNGVSDEVAAVEEVLRRALELACSPQETPLDPQVEGEPNTATSMAMHLATLATAAQEEARQSRQQLQAQQQEVVRLQEQLSRARQDGERWASALQRAQREALEREATRGAEQARQQELIRDMKGRLLELLREKDALWQKTEGIDTPMPSPAPRDVGLCTRCHKDFRLLSRRYNCRLCQGKVCHACSVDVGKQGRCCLLCYQQRHPQAT
ncbi:run and fyve domain-containing protein 4 [Limosa lapponica baueri]|uniref:RUN and FYVE domain-containing protein 4 n=2 Tax=Scolopacidae TaxID=8917 RepID=A0A2I0UKJ8_LIMLA|nr:run and fyve domain-containing protein 4 [Limosa lapponica baueri]